jgi:Vitamin K-dependent gamma-carboxylase
VITRERAVAAWERFWFEPVETSIFALFRIAFALVMLGWTLSLSPGLYEFFSNDGVLPEQPSYADDARWGLLGIFESDIAVTLVYFLMFIATLALLVGFRTRLAAFLVFICIASFQRRNPFVLNSGDQLLQVLAFFLVLMPAGVSLSVDRWLKRGEDFWAFPTRSIWPLRLVQIQVSILYLSAVWAKVRGTTWNDGTAVSYAFRIDDIARFPVPDFITDSILIANLLTYGTLAVELALGILVWNRVLRPWVLLAGVGLHLGIDYAVRVGFFSYGVFVAYIAFLPPQTASAFILAARERLTGFSLRPPLKKPS